MRFLLRHPAHFIALGGGAGLARYAPGTFGTAGRNILRGIQTKSFNLSLLKSVRFLEPKAIEFRAEFFNAFNQVRFNPPNLDSSSPFFGQIQGAQPPRILQFSLRLQF